MQTWQHLLISTKHNVSEMVKNEEMTHLDLMVSLEDKSDDRHQILFQNISLKLNSSSLDVSAAYRIWQTTATQHAALL